MPDLMVKIDGDTSGLDEATGKAKSSISSFKGIDIPLPGIGQIAMVTGAIAGLGKITLDTVQAGKDAAAAQAEFARQMQIAGAASTGWEDKANSAIAAAQEMAFSDDEAMQALTTLATKTHSVDAAIALLPSAMDLARKGTGDLAGAADAMTEAMGGSDAKILKIMDGMEKGANSTETLNNALTLSAGAADTWAQSGDAASIKFQMALSEAMEFIGTELMPAFDELGHALEPLMASFMKFLQTIWPPVKLVLMALIQIISTIIGWVNTAVEALGKMWTAVNNLLVPIQELIDKIASIDLNPLHALQDIDINPFDNKSAPTPEGASASSRAATPAPVNITMNISGDPTVIEAKVTQALRRYTRRNGPGTVYNPGRS